MANMQKMNRIAHEIQKVFKSFEGAFVVPKNAYEQAFCDILGWQYFDGRYYDAFNGETFIEIKKGQSSMHFDMIRYAEIFLGFGTQNTATVFFKWNKQRSRVEEAMIIDTVDLIKFLRIDNAMARSYLRIRDTVPRGVNILASATASDLRSISTHIVSVDTPIKSPYIIRLQKWSRLGAIIQIEKSSTSDCTKWPKINIIL